MHSRHCRIILCGSYTQGATVLEQIRDFIRQYYPQTFLCRDLYPTEQGASAGQTQEATRRCMQESAAYLFVYLSPESLGVRHEDRDLIGGTAFERGSLDKAHQRGDVELGVLIDGNAMVRWLSSTLKGKLVRHYEVSNPAGDLRELKELALVLCAELWEAICPS